VAVRRELLDGSLMAAVEFRQVSFRVGGHLILDNVSFEVASGETLVLLGRSGSGKTTALKMVNGLLFPGTGEVLVDNRATTAWDLIQLRRGIGYVIQEVGLFPHFTIGENVGLVPRLEGWAAERVAARTKELLEEVGLAPAEFLERYPRQLSGGQRQRVGVARALAADPRLLLFDEPFGALDPVTRLELQNQFLALRGQLRKTSIFVTHDVREALRIGTRIALLDRGRLETLATPEQFLKSPGQQTRAFLEVLDLGPQMNADERR
jgi:osmoprotectant transport system ATP-binding protein